MRVIVVHNRHGINGAAWVSDEDFERLSQYRWFMNHAPGSRTKYARATIDGKMTFMQHAVIGKKEGLEVDHIDGDGLNNQRENLEHVTHSENIRRAQVLKPYNREEKRGGIRWTVATLADGSTKTYFYSKKTGKRVPEEEAMLYFPDGLPERTKAGIRNRTNTEVAKGFAKDV